MQALRSLFLTKHFPYPPMGGAAIRNWQNINLMKQIGSVALFSIDIDGNSATDFPDQIELGQNISITELDSQRIWRDRLTRKFWQFRPYGHPLADRYFTVGHQQQLKQILEKFQPHLVIFEEPWTYHYLPIVQKYGCRIVYDAHNVESCLSREVHYTNSGQKSAWQNYQEVQQIRKLASIERSLIRQCDQTWVCSQDELPLIQQIYPTRKEPPVIPNGINVLSYGTSGQLDSENFSVAIAKHVLVFSATFLHPPNAVAAEQLIKHVYPQLLQIYPDCRLLLVGRFPTDLMKAAAAEDDQIIVTGEVPDVRPYLAAGNVMAVPLFQGGGTRLKILEAFAAGCPVVSTSKGAEGLVGQTGKHLMVVETTEQMVQAIHQLWADPEQAHRLALAARHLVQAEYSWEAILPRVKQAVEQISLEVVHG